MDAFHSSHYPLLDEPLYPDPEFFDNGPVNLGQQMSPRGHRNAVAQQAGDLQGNDSHKSNTGETFQDAVKGCLEEMIQLLLESPEKLERILESMLERKLEGVLGSVLESVLEIVLERKLESVLERKLESVLKRIREENKRTQEKTLERIYEENRRTQEVFRRHMVELMGRRPGPRYSRSHIPPHSDPVVPDLQQPNLTRYVHISV
ncbi:hypothetical protein AA0119_g13598 [Alternaria tenuissima]|uniref:Uncharacterized protein n=1 Tax=Alternaria tenuissima TaxID=119927 RepID=A0ABY0FNH4_9PLEO|nr:hypothetical protein AA0119_g13598 [Alternaria tenuissima]RYN94606.1 hypothetical protein AA0121_g13596 [Alternaria tenuissima]